jgi:hypothetical protein
MRQSSIGLRLRSTNTLTPQAPNSPLDHPLRGYSYFSES